MLTLRQIETELHIITNNLIDEWFDRQIKNIYANYYLWCREAQINEEISIPVIAEDKPSSSYWLVAKLSRNLDKATAKTIILNELRRQPILNGGL